MIRPMMMYGVEAWTVTRRERERERERERARERERGRVTGENKSENAAMYTSGFAKG